MLRKFLENIPKRWISYTLLLTVVIEAITCLFRFGFSLQSTRDTQMMAKFTFGIRIHHGYIGILMVIIFLYLYKDKDKTSSWFWGGIIIGMSLFLSDMVHHFLVLWPITGSPQFDFTYSGG